MNKKSWKLASIVVALGLAGAAAATTAVMRLKDGEVKKGQTMTDVRGKMGEPVSVVGPLGFPQVTKWTMASGEVVVFIDQYVHDAFVVVQ